MWIFRRPFRRISTTVRVSTSAKRMHSERKDNFEHIECGMTAQEAAQERGRCLRCDHYGYGIFKGGRAAIW